MPSENETHNDPVPHGLMTFNFIILTGAGMWAMWALAQFIIPTGFILFIPFLAVGAWTRFDVIENWHLRRRFRAQLNEGLHFDTESDTLEP